VPVLDLVKNGHNSLFFNWSVLLYPFQVHAFIVALTQKVDQLRTTLFRDSIFQFLGVTGLEERCAL
jgi:hypothetical protein